MRTRGEHELLADGQPIEQAWLLGDQTDVPADILRGRDDVIARDADRARRRSQQRGEHPHRRRPSRAVGSEETGDLAGWRVEGDTVEHALVAEDANETVNLDH